MTTGWSGSRSAVIQTARGVVFAEPVTDAVGRIGAVDLAVTYGVTRGGDDQVAITAITLRPGTSVTAADLTEAVAAMPVGLPPDVVHVVADLPLSATYRPVVGGLRNAGIPAAGGLVSGPRTSSAAVYGGGDNSSS